jgi:ankyrin repeat protein
MDVPTERVVRLLAARGADINAQDTNGFAPLHLCAARGLVRLCGVLLECGADLNVRERHGRTPLFEACVNGDLPTVTFLIARGADLGALDTAEWTMLDALGLELRAAGPVAPQISQLASMLREQGVRPSLCAAISLGLHDDVTQLLSTRSPTAQSDEKTVQGTTPLMWALFRRDAIVVQELLAHKPAVNQLTNHGGSALGMAVSMANGDVNMVQLLLDAGADPNLRSTTDGSGLSALHTAAIKQDEATARLLLAHGADPNAMDNTGKTPFDWARRANAPDSILQLLAPPPANAGAPAGQK